MTQIPKRGKIAANVRLVSQICWIAFALMIFGGGLYSCVAEDNSRGLLAEQTLVADYRLIRRPPFAKRTEFRHVHKGDRASVEGSYQAAVNWRDLRRYYDAEMARLGWKLVSDEPLGSPYGAQGGRTALFCRGPYEARLDFAHEGARDDWTYALALSWTFGNSPQNCTTH